MRQTLQARSGPPVETAMSATPAFSCVQADPPLQHAATAPTASLVGLEAASQDLAKPMEEDDGQEVAGDNQLELQQHAESQDHSIQHDKEQDVLEDQTPARTADGVEVLPQIQLTTWSSGKVTTLQ